MKEDIAGGKRIHAVPTRGRRRMGSRVMSQRSFLKMSAGSVALLAATAACGGGDEEAEDGGSEPLIEFNDPPSVNVDLSGLVPVEAGSVLVFNSQGDQYDDGRTVWVEGSTEGPIV